MFLSISTPAMVSISSGIWNLTLQAMPAQPVHCTGCIVCFLWPS